MKRLVYSIVLMLMLCSCSQVADKIPDNEYTKEVKEVISSTETETQTLTCTVLDKKDVEVMTIPAYTIKIHDKTTDLDTWLKVDSEAYRSISIADKVTTKVRLVKVKESTTMLPALVLYELSDFEIEKG